MKVLDSIALALLIVIYVIVGICAIYCLKFFVGIARQDNVNR